MKPLKPDLFPNPFQHAGLWFWLDETETAHGPYKTQMEALNSLLRHICPSWYERLWAKIVEFWHDTKS